MKKTFALLAMSLAFIACDKNEEKNEEQVNNEKTSYEFMRNGESSVAYSGQIERLDMLTEMGAYMSAANALGTSVSETQLHQMFKNEGGFEGTYAKNLFSKCFPADQQFYLDMMSEMAVASNSTVNAKPGIAGVLNEEYPAAGSASSAGYLVNENGLEYKQVIEKGLMGAVFFYQASEVYFGVDYMNMDGSDNNELSEGKNYTSMEHHYDEAFGYFGVATDFSDADVTKDASRGRFWGKYCIERHTDGDDYGMPGVNGRIMRAFIDGREAVVSKDYTARNESIQQVINEWEMVIANTAANYFKRSLSEENNPTYKQHHYLSEGIAFMMALQYHQKIGNSVAERYVDYDLVNDALEIIGLETNLYAVTDTEINLVLDKLNAAIPAATNE